MSGIRYPEGTTLINVLPEIDRDEKDCERITPTGSYWRVWKVSGEVRQLACDETGAWISPDIETLDRDFRLKPAPEEGSEQ